MFNFLNKLLGNPLKSEPTDMNGLIKISGCDNPKRCADVIFVHGLGGTARGTWHPQELNNDDNFWLMWLAQERPDLGIWSFGYQAAPSEWKGATMPLFDRASNLLEYLAINDIGERKIIFITHSMGGLLVKKMLQKAQTFRKNSVIEQTKGIVFLSTPHTGSHLANLVDKIGTLARSTVSVDELKIHIPQLRELNEWYRQNVESMEIDTKVYYETKPVKGILVVDPDSANPGIKDVEPIATDDDHISITKPKSKDSFIYKGVNQFIKKILSTVPQEPEKSPIQPNSSFYIQRPEIDNKCYEAIQQPGALIRIKAPRYMGKTFLMNSIIEYAKKQNYRTTSINLWSQEDLTDLNTFLQRFCINLSEKLGLEDQIDKYWSKRLSSQVNCTNYFEKYLLKSIETPLVLGLDNIDEIFPYTEITQQFSALLRAWHEAATTEEIWKKLRLVISHSQEVYVSLNVNQSPFNVGLPMEIGEFNLTQVKELIQQYKLNWSDGEIQQLREMIDGHPYLLRIALDQIAQGNLTLAEFLETAPTEGGLYRSFLNSYLLEIKKDDVLKTAMQQVINSDIPIKIDSEQAFKLRSLGLIEYKGNEVKCLCNLYRLYFQKRL